jgi:hypothetical protein
MEEQEQRGRPAKHDYEMKDFYLAIEALATRGYYDGEIADELNLHIDVFNKMKNGKYAGWTEKENEERGARIRETLLRARRKTNSLVRSTYLKIALGAKKLVNTTRRYVEDRCECGGQDPMCPYCGGTGKIVTQKAIIQETEAEMPPNLQALATWLHHHDPEWVKTEGGVTEAQNVQETKKGIDIVEWITAMTTDKHLTNYQQQALKANEKNAGE